MSPTFDAPLVPQAYHRGIYEHLWSEHRFRVLAVSHKKYQTACAKLGRNPQVSNLLRILEQCLTPLEQCYGGWPPRPSPEQCYRPAELPGRLEGLLGVYLQLQPHLTRRERWELIEGFLADPHNGRAALYVRIRQEGDPALGSGRLFLPEVSSWKIWDYGDNPGFWLCFGPFQLHLSFSTVKRRVLSRAQQTEAEFDRLMHEFDDPNSQDLQSSGKAGVTRRLAPPEHPAGSGSAGPVRGLPGFDAVIPGFDAVIPGSDTVIPGSDAAMPGSDAAIPGFDAAMSGFDAVIPGIIAAKPTPSGPMLWNRYDELPASTKSALEEHFLAIPVGDRVWRHPRVPADLPLQPQETVSLEAAAALALERLWDEHPALIPDLPAWTEWRPAFTPEAMPEVIWAEAFPPEEAYDFLVHSFQQQKLME